MSLLKKLVPTALRRCVPSKLKRGVSKSWLIIDSLSRSKKQLTFVQIGANDGKRWDLIHDLIQRDGWRGLLVEPLPVYFEALKKNYANQPGLSFERAALADTDGQTALYRVDTTSIELPEWFEGAATFSRELLLTHRHLHPDFEKHIIAETVPALTLATLLRKHKIDDADLFYIDTEGYDYHVVKQILRLPWRPEVIHYEHNHLSEAQRTELETELKSRHYKTLLIENDTIAWQANHEKLRLTDCLPFQFLKK